MQPETGAALTGVQECANAGKLPECAEQMKQMAEGGARSLSNFTRAELERECALLQLQLSQIQHALDHMKLQLQAYPSFLLLLLRAILRQTFYCLLLAISRMLPFTTFYLPIFVISFSSFLFLRIRPLYQRQYNFPLIIFHFRSFST